MTRFLYFLSLLKKEKKRKKGAGSLFNLEQMENVMYWSLLYLKEIKIVC